MVLTRRDRAETGLVDSSRSSVPSLLVSPVFLRRFRRAITPSSTSAEDVFRFLRTRDPSNGSSPRTNLSNIEWESGLIVPFCGGRRSLANFGAVDRRVAGAASVSTIPLTVGLIPSGSSPLSDSSPIQSGHLQLSGPLGVSWLSQHAVERDSLCSLVRAPSSRAHC